MHRSRCPRSVVTAVLAIAFALHVPAARAEVSPKLRVIDHGAEVEVLVTGVRMVAEPTLKVSRERIEVVLFGRPVEVMDTFKDRTVQRVDVRGVEPRGNVPRVLSVKLKGDHAMALALLPGARAEQGDDGVHVWIQRAVPAAAAAVTAAQAVAPTAPALPPPAGAATGITVTGAGASPSVAPNLKPNLGPSVTPTPSASPNPSPSPSPSTGPSTSPSPGANAGATPPSGDNVVADTLLPAPRPSSARIARGTGGPAVGRVVIAIAVIGLVGLAALLLRRRRAAAPADGPKLEVLATQDLGNKTRVVWLGAGERELVISVAAQQVRLLGQWRRGEAGRPSTLRLAAGADDAAHGDGEPVFAAGSSQLPRVRGLATPAVSGIMRLRGKLTPITDEVATGDSDADEQWARDILAATGGRR